MILNVFLEILRGHENPSNPNISQLHGGARQKSAGNSNMMAKLLCFTFASSIVCRNLLFPILPFTLLSLPGRTETTDRAAVLRTELIRPNSPHRRTARTDELSAPSDFPISEMPYRIHPTHPNRPTLYRPRPFCYFFLLFCPLKLNHS